jgi:hypothetical protein
MPVAQALAIWRSLGIAQDGLGVVGIITGCPHRPPLLGERRWLATMLPPFEPPATPEATFGRHLEDLFGAAGLPAPGVFVVWCYGRLQATVADIYAHQAVGLSAAGAATDPARAPSWSRVTNLEVLARCQRIAAAHGFARPLLRA